MSTTEKQNENECNHEVVMPIAFDPKIEQVWCNACGNDNTRIAYVRVDEYRSYCTGKSKHAGKHHKILAIEAGENNRAYCVPCYQRITIAYTCKMHTDKYGITCFHLCQNGESELQK